MEENKKPSNPNAFPGKDDNAFGQETGHYYGMTLRDYVAAKTIQGICADGHTFWDSQQFQGSSEYIVQKGFEIADEFLKQREL